MLELLFCGPILLATLMALITFLLFIEVDIANITSPLEAKPLICLLNECSYPKSFDIDVNDAELDVIDIEA